MKLKNEYINNTPYDKRILKVLRQVDKSLPSTSIALLVGLSMDKVDRILETCSKHKLCKKTTKKVVNYWKWVGDNE